ncbi:LPS export ABC transporter periplasmic protein LptC [Endozoicomonas sp. SM1973]|uniref:Lipopolysaccharide export system protein LptC n=1 Tax=Spartinivicinus marinus TaxID=2994442 RepID=A0A853HZC7_9GAMM|nr:LPS export ABC transporter periplasmic protein LptC [Spartinivicinus marinus]MCX4025726.1 LPS export ABC transporter periplasmic protein LptC [Spartinivicinus marinus]NYZ65719.1 LPS export ABC transporter periplasmic protein LptC [Spartinivicinus marinus]
MNRSSIISLIAILVIAYCGYLAFGTSSTPVPSSNEPLADNLEQAPDYYLINPRVTQFTLEGNKDYLLIADKISHYPHNDVSLLAQPNIDLYKANSSDQWKTTARHGRLLPGGDILELSDQVRVKELKSNGELGTLLKTDFLTLYAEEEVADTQHPVVITSPNGSITQGVGMRAFLAKDRIQLFSNVRGHYEVNQ